MTSLALAWPGGDAYAVDFATPTLDVLARMSPEARAELKQRLNQIAEVASALSSMAADGIGSTLRLEIAGHAVSYVVSDARRTLTVLSLVPTPA